MCGKGRFVSHTVMFNGSIALQFSIFIQRNKEESLYRLYFVVRFEEEAFSSSFEQAIFKWVRLKPHEASEGKWEYFESW